MNETMDYIDRYFQKSLSKIEAAQFEERCQTDEDFADSVAFYIMSREAVRQKLVEEKSAVWAATENVTEAKVVPISPVRRKSFTQWISYAAAACVLLIVGLFYLYPKASPQSLAHNYVQENLLHLSHTMDGSTDSMQKGIDAYNNTNYTEALTLFAALYKSHPDNNEALENAGLVYLKQKDYDRALAQFTELSNKKLVSNRGLFLKAVTLLERAASGDEAAAKRLLEKVRDERLEGDEEAAKWLKKW